MPGGIAVTWTVDPEPSMTVTTGNDPHGYSCIMNKCNGAVDGRNRNPRETSVTNESNGEVR